MFNSKSPLHLITDEDHARITVAIQEVEKKTSGEVYAVVAHQSDDYFFVSGFMAALWTLMLGVLLAIIAWVLDIEISALGMASAQIASFIASLLCIYFVPALKFILVPRLIAHRRASNNAMRQFLAHGIHTTKDRSGVLLFMSLAERYAQVIADEGINNVVEQSDWDDMVTVLTRHAAMDQVAEGFLMAIEQSGALLATHFPPSAKQQNELNDRLVEI